MKKNKKSEALKTVKARLKPAMIVLKIILAVLTLIFPVFMVVMTGAGLIYNSESYGEELTRTGFLFIVSGALMAFGCLLCIIKKNIVSLICSCGGFALCMGMLYKLVEHADAAGWSDKFTMERISVMYIQRIVPTAAPFIIAVVIALIQFFSYEAAEKRRQKKKLREEKENQPAPPIIE